MYQNFQLFFGKSYMSSAFSIKLSVVYYRAATLLKCWSTIHFYSKYFLRQPVFVTYSKKNL